MELGLGAERETVDVVLGIVGLQYIERVAISVYGLCFFCVVSSSDGLIGFYSGFRDMGMAILQGIFPFWVNYNCALVLLPKSFFFLFIQIFKL